MTALLSVLHVCTGNICRSPMSERILDGITGEDVFNHGAGISSFHEGENMQANAMDELESRGFDPDGHRARHLTRAHIDASDLILAATTGHLEFMAERFPDAVAKTFLVRTFGRMATDLADSLPDGDIAVRGKALVAAAEDRRADYDEINLSDPWGMQRAVYSQIAEQLEEALRPVALALESRP